MARFPKSDMISLTQESVRYDLAESVGPDLLYGELLGDAAPDGLANLALGYGKAQGDPRLRAAIAERHGVQPDQVLVTVGGMHALFLLAFTLCDKGDEAVTTTPLFPLARNVLEAVGAKITSIPVSFESGYRLDPDRFAASLSSQTKLVLLTSPQNPSGIAISQEDANALLAAMREHAPDAVLVMDETYREAAYGEDSVVESAARLGAKVVACASLSKCHGAPGLRIGWAIATDEELREELLRAKFNTVISNSRVDEALAIEVLAQQARIVGERRRHLAEGLATTQAWVERHAAMVDWVRPDAGALCCLRLKPTVFDDAAVRRFYDALRAEGTRVANGSWFGDEDRVFRLGFGLLSMPELEAGLAVLSSALQQAAPKAA